MAKGKRQASRSIKKMTRIYLSFILITSLILSVFAVIWANDIFALIKKDEVISIEIPPDATTGKVAKILDKAGVIEYGSIFTLFTNFTVKKPQYVSGKYELNSKMDYRAIISTVRKNPNSKNVVRITIPEGYTVSQIIDELVDKNVATRVELEDTASNYKYKHNFLQDIPLGKNRLEGYLFPDTYEFYENDNPVMVFNKMLNNFSAKVDDDIWARASSMGLSKHQVITIASLIEREAKIEDEQVKISAVIHNRLKSKEYPYLQVDASVLYAVGHKNELSKEDLKVKSPYNTYTNKGLPPGPIAGPGYAAIYAAVNPEKSSNYFYVAKKDGTHIFTKTLDEHNRAIATIREKGE